MVTNIHRAIESNESNDDGVWSIERDGQDWSEIGIVPLNRRNTPHTASSDIYEAAGC